MYNINVRGPVIQGNKDCHKVTEDICNPLDTKPGKWWNITFIICLIALAIGAWGIYFTLHDGLGTWGLNDTVNWGYGIINFVWWIGIGHAGTAFSIFFSFRSKMANIY